MQEKQQTVKLLNGELVYGLMHEILDYCKNHDTSIKNEYTNNDLIEKDIFIEVEKRKFKAELLLKPLKNTNFKNI